MKRRTLKWRVLMLVAIIALLLLQTEIGASQGKNQEHDLYIEPAVLKAFENSTEVKIIVWMRDTTGIRVTADMPLTIQKALKKEYNRLMGKKTEKVLSKLLREESEHLRKFYDENGFYGYVTRPTIGKISQDSDVAAIYLDRFMHAYLAESGPLISTPDVHRLGLTGKDQTVCVIDTGVDYSLPALGGGWGDDYKVWHTENTIDGSGNLVDDSGHGTHVAGIIAAKDPANPQYRGIAPEARIVAIKAGDKHGYWDDAIAGALKICFNKSDSYNISVVTMSLGIALQEDDCPGTLNGAIEQLIDLNIPVIAATGNEELRGAIGYPSCAPGVISVGATDKKNRVAGYTNLDYSPLVPDLFAPGGVWGRWTDPPPYKEIVSAYSQAVKDNQPNPGEPVAETNLCFSWNTPWFKGGFNRENWTCNDPYLEVGGGQYIRARGTSMAAPHVAGAAALLRQANPLLSPDELELIFKQTGKPVENWLSIDVKAAVDSALERVQPLTIENTGDADLIIEGISDDKGWIEMGQLPEFPYTLKPDNELKILVKVSADGLGPRVNGYSGTISILTNDPEGPTIIPVTMNLFCTDRDKDGYYDEDNPSCSRANDCDPNNKTIHLGAVELYYIGSTCSDLKDNDCDGAADNRDDGCRCTGLKEGDDLVQSTTLQPDCVYDIASGINVDADYVVLDCQGSVLKGWMRDGYCAVNATKVSGVVLRNCEFSGFMCGLKFKDSKGGIYGSLTLHYEEDSSIDMVGGTLSDVEFHAAEESGTVSFSGGNFSVVRSLFNDSVKANELANVTFDSSVFLRSVVLNASSTGIVINHSVVNASLDVDASNVVLGGNVLDQRKVPNGFVIDRPDINLCDGTAGNRWLPSAGGEAIDVRASYTMNPNCTQAFEGAGTESRAIRLSAPDTVLDCAGAGLAGTASALGVDSAGHFQTIRDCNLSGFGEGIRANKDYASILGNTLGEGGITLKGGTIGAQVQNNTLVDADLVIEGEADICDASGNSNQLLGASSLRPRGIALDIEPECGYRADGGIVLDSNVTIECSGATLSGNGVAGLSISTPQNARVSVRNCRFEGYRKGLQIASGGKDVGLYGLMLDSAEDSSIALSGGRLTRLEFNAELPAAIVHFYGSNYLVSNTVFNQTVHIASEGVTFDRVTFLKPVTITGDNNIITNSVFEADVAIQAASGNSVQASVFGDISLALDSATSHHLIADNDFRGTQISDNGAGNSWCLNYSIENRYTLGASYTGTDPRQGRCNSPPLFSSELANEVVWLRQTLYLKAECHDPEHDDVIYSDTSTKLDIDPTTGEIFWTPTEADLGTHRVDVSCTDLYEGSTQTFYVSVIGRGSWWDGAWPHRRAVVVANGGASTLQAQYTAKIVQDFTNEEILPDGRDLRMLRGATKVPYIVRGDIAAGPVTIYFPLQQPIPAGGQDIYYLYYGNPAAQNPGYIVDNVFGRMEPDASTKALYHMDEGGGAPRDASVSAAHLTLGDSYPGGQRQQYRDSGWTGSDSFFTAGNSAEPSGYGTFSGPDYASLNFAGTDITIGGWVKHSSYGLSNVLCKGGAPSGAVIPEGGWMLYIDGTSPYGVNKPGARVHTAGGVEAAVSAVHFLPDDGQWHFVVFTMDSGHKYLYIDGVQAAGGPRDHPGAQILPGSGWSIDTGYYCAEMRNPAPKTDELFVMSRAMSAEEAAFLYEHRRKFNPTEAVYSVGFAEPMNNPPMQAKPVIIPDPAFDTDTLACIPQNVWDIEGDPVQNITNWLVDNASITLLHIPFEGAGGGEAAEARDYSGYGNTGTVRGAAWDRASGIRGGAYLFDGVDDLISIGDSSSLNPVGVFSVSAWIRPSALSQDRNVIAAKWGSSSGSWLLSLDNGNLSVSLSPDGTPAGPVLAMDTAIMALNAWSHVAFSVDVGTGEVRLYRNGVQVGATGVYSSSAFPVTDVPVTIGATADSDEAFSGRIDEVRVYSRAISAAQIANLGAGLDTIAPDETLAWETWSCEVTPNDGYLDGETKSASIFINRLNTPPTQDELLITPEQPQPTDALLCTPQNVQDAEGDPVQNITNWQMNGVSSTALLMPFEANTDSRITKDYSGHANDATVSGAAWLRRGGLMGGAFAFDGDENSYIEAQDAPSLNPGEITVEMWVHPESLTNGRGGAAQALLDKSSEVEGYGFWLLSDGSIRWQVGETVATSRPAWTLGEWQHIAFTANSTHTNAYRNGIALLRFSVPWTGALASAGSLRIGGEQGSEPNAFIGRMDEVRVHTRALSAEQLLGHADRRYGTLSPAETPKASRWTCSVTPNDGIADGETKSDTVALPNRPPTHDNPIITPDPSSEEDDLTCTPQDVQDPDGDAVTAFTTWYRKGLTDKLFHLRFENSATDFFGDMPTAAEGTAFVPSSYGYGAAIGPAGYLAYASAGNINPSRGTVEFWVKPGWDGSDSQNHYFLDTRSASGGRLAIRKDAANVLSCTAYEDNGVAHKKVLLPVHSSNFAEGEWHHIACSWDDAESIRLYLDGEEVGTYGSNGGRQLAVGDEIVVGAQWDATQSADSVIDELIIYDTVLPPEQIQLHSDLRYDVLSANRTSKRETWSCEVTPNDGFLDGEAKRGSILVGGVNEPPVLDSVNATLDFVELGGAQTILSLGANDPEEDPLSLVCCAGRHGACTPTTENNICEGENSLHIEAGDYALLGCNYTSSNGIGTESVWCAAYDGLDYSAPVLRDSYLVGFAYAIELSAGWNAIGLPLQPFEEYNASAFAERIRADTGKAVEAVVRYDPLAGEMVWCDLGALANSSCEWMIQAGEGYFVLMNGSASWTVRGFPWRRQT